MWKKILDHSFDGIFLEGVSPAYQLLFRLRILTADARISTASAKSYFLLPWQFFFFPIKN